nr:MAG TPA: hypothetical protein [Caudoviricetes sp.]
MLNSFDQVIHCFSSFKIAFILTLMVILILLFTQVLTTSPAWF